MQKIQLLNNSFLNSESQIMHLPENMIGKLKLYKENIILFRPSIQVQLSYLISY